MIFKCLTILSLNSDACIVAVNSVKACGADNNIKCINFAVCSVDAPRSELGYLICLDVDDVNIVATGLLVVSSITQRSPCIELGKTEFLSLL